MKAPISSEPGRSTPSAKMPPQDRKSPTLPVGPESRQEVRPRLGAHARLLLPLRDVRAEFGQQGGSPPRGDRFDRPPAACWPTPATLPPSSSRPTWAPVQAFGPDLVDGVRPIIPQDGPELILWGDSTLTSTLLEQGLADDVGPTVVNKGKEARLSPASCSPRHWVHAPVDYGAHPRRPR